MGRDEEGSGFLSKWRGRRNPESELDFLSISFSLQLSVCIFWMNPWILGDGEGGSSAEGDGENMNLSSNFSLYLYPFLSIPLSICLLDGPTDPWRSREQRFRQ